MIKRNFKIRLYELPFDVFQRHKRIQEIVTLIRENRKQKILDVGGFPGLMPDFLSNDNTFVLDKNYLNAKKYIMGNGLYLPFKDKYFDIVLAIDVLEHIFGSKRIKFINELLRVSKKFLIIAAPFKDNLISEAEEGIYSFYKRNFKKDNLFLKEHIKLDLPELNKIEGILKQKKLSFLKLPNGYLPNWYLMMLLNTYILNLTDYDSFHRHFNRFYNLNFYYSDNRYPSYRQILLISKTTINKNVKRKLKRPRCAVNSNNTLYVLLQVFLNIFNKQLKRNKRKFTEIERYAKSLEKQLENDKTNIAEIERYTTSLTNELTKKSIHITEVDQYAESLEKQLENDKTNIAEIERYTTSLTNELTKKSIHITEVDQYAESLEKQLENDKTNIAEIERYTTSLTNELTDKNKYISELEKILSLPFVSVIVLSYNSTNYIERCLNSLMQIEYPKQKFEIIVVDNGSKDSSVQIIKNRFLGEVTMIESKKNLGFAKGINLGLRSVRGDIVMLINPDVVVEKKCFIELVKILSSDNKIGIGGCKIYYLNSNILQHAGGLIRPNGLTLHYGYGDEDSGQYEQVKDVDYVTGAVMAIKRELLNTLGFFDPSYFMYYDDADYCVRARKAGYRVVYVPKAVAYHFESYSAKKFSKFYLYNYHKSRLQFVFKNFSFKQLVKDFLPLECKWFIFHCDRFVLWVVIIAYLRIFLLLPKILFERYKKYNV